MPHDGLETGKEGAKENLEQEKEEKRKEGRRSGRHARLALIKAITVRERQEYLHEEVKGRAITRSTVDQRREKGRHHLAARGNRHQPLRSDSIRASSETTEMTNHDCPKFTAYRIERASL